MTLQRTGGAACALLTLFSAATAAQEAPVPLDRGATAFVGVNVVPMDRDTVLPGRTVLVRDGHIVTVGAVDSVDVPIDARVVDGLNGYLVPGLTDLHAHPTDRHEFPLWLAYGVTRVQYLNALDHLPRLAAEVASGPVLGPVLHPCAGPVSGIQDPDTARATVVRLAALGFRCIKPYGDLSEEAFRAMVAESRARGIRTVGHIPRNLEWQQVLAAGPTAVAHAEEFLYSPIRDRADLERIDSLMTTNQVALIATLVNYDAISRQPIFAARLLEDPDMAFYSPVDRRYWVPGRNHYVRDFPPERVPRLRALLAFQGRLVRRLRDAGVLLGAGTDAGNTMVLPGRSLHEELALLVSAGLTPYEALRTATIDAARLLSLDRATGVGTVTEGAPADLVLLLGNPLEDIHNTGLLAGVMARGLWQDRAALDGALAEKRAGFAAEERVIAALEHDGVQAALDTVAAISARSAVPAPLRPRALNELAYQLWKIEDLLPEAMLIFQANASMHPDWWAAHGSLGEAYEALGRREAALASFRRAVVLAPWWAEGQRRVRALAGGG